MPKEMTREDRLEALRRKGHKNLTKDEHEWFEENIVKHNLERYKTLPKFDKMSNRTALR